MFRVRQNSEAESKMVDGTDKHSGMDGDQRRRAAGKKGKKDDLDNLKKEVEMVRSTDMSHQSVEELLRPALERNQWRRGGPRGCTNRFDPTSHKATKACKRRPWVYSVQNLAMIREGVSRGAQT